MDIFDIDDNYGVDDGLVHEEDDEGVEVPQNTLQMSEQLSELQEAIDPLSDSEDYGISIYTRTIHYLDNL